MKASSRKQGQQSFANKKQKQEQQSLANGNRKLRAAVLCKWKPEIKGHSPLQMNSRRQGRSPLQTKAENAQVLISGMAVSTSCGGGGGGTAIPHAFTRTAVHLNFVGTAVPYANETTIL